MLGYIELGKFDVHIIGHSCGMSDKTLLSIIFEHPNCVEVKNYHQGTIEEDFNKRLNISRHYKDKAAMRERIANYDAEAVIPQLAENES
jgi:3-hydroxyisobutyrate dehydrogenase-like beta-hydroxyacid dehydrogenase